MRKRGLLLVLLLGGAMGPVSGPSSLNGQSPASLTRGQPGGAPTSCSTLASQTMPGAAIAFARTIEAGTFTPPGDAAGSLFASLPAFCRVAATLKPSADSEINVEVWMPAA